MKIRNILTGSLGVIGYILYFVLMFLMTAIPVYLLGSFGVPTFVQIIILVVIIFSDIIGTFATPVLYIVSFFAAIRFEVMWVSIVYFVCLALYLVFFVIPTVISMIKS